MASTRSSGLMSESFFPFTRTVPREETFDAADVAFEVLPEGDDVDDDDDLLSDCRALHSRVWPDCFLADLWKDGRPKKPGTCSSNASASLGSRPGSWRAKNRLGRARPIPP
jgi:hypothetical protein